MKDVFALLTMIGIIIGLIIILAANSGCTNKSQIRTFPAGGGSKVEQLPEPAVPQNQPYIVPGSRPVDVGPERIDESIYFGFDDDRINPTAMLNLDRICNEIRNDEHAMIHLNGYACPIGDAGYNVDLSWRRAKAAQTYIEDVCGLDCVTHMYGHGEDKGAIEGKYELSRRVDVGVR